MKVYVKPKMDISEFEEDIITVSGGNGEGGNGGGGNGGPGNGNGNGDGDGSFGKAPGLLLDPFEDPGDQYVHP